MGRKHMMEQVIFDCVEMVLLIEYFKVDEFVETIRPTYDDDCVDRLHYFWTCLITFAFSTAIGAYQFRGRPIQCWVPKEYPDPWESYVEDYCFTENIYYVNHYDRPIKELHYYPWIPLILALQGTMFYVPHFIWTCLNWQSGVNIRSIILKMKVAQNRIRNAHHVAEHIEQTLDLEVRIRGRSGFLPFLIRCGATHGFYLTCIYLLTKLMNVGNAIGQFFALNYFLGISWTRMWGFHFIKTLRIGQKDRNTMPPSPFPLVWNGLFPRTIMCHVDVKLMSSVIRAKIQCVLWINMLNETIFLFLWWWYLTVATISILNFIYWCLISLIPANRHRFIVKYLKGRNLIRNGSDTLAKKFVARKLRADGVFILRLISENVGDLVTSDIIEVIFRNYSLEQRGGRRQKNAETGV